MDESPLPLPPPPRTMKKTRTHAGLVSYPAVFIQRTKAESGEPAEIENLLSWSLRQPTGFRIRALYPVWERDYVWFEICTRSKSGYFDRSFTDLAPGYEVDSESTSSQPRFSSARLGEPLTSSLLISPSSRTNEVGGNSPKSLPSSSPSLHRTSFLPTGPSLYPQSASSARLGELFLPSHPLRYF